MKVVRKGQATVERVMWEIHVLRQLNATPHPHIVKLVDVIDVVDACYMIMERVDGPQLSRFIHSQEGGVLPLPTARRLFAQLTSALRHANRAGFVHMDVKPENVRLHPVAASGAEHAVLLDWGYARRLGPQSEPIRQGTPLYAAPEQLTGYSTDGVSARATLSETVDVWGLGATLCEMCCGSPPFAGRDFEQLVGNVLQLNLVAAARVISGPPRELLDEMLQILPSDRATLDELYEHQWVADSGGLPTLDDVALLCEDCSDGPGGGAKRSRLLDGCGEREWPAWRRRLLTLFYTALVVGLLLWCQANGVGGAELDLVET